MRVVVPSRALVVVIVALVVCMLSAVNAAPVPKWYNKVVNGIKRIVKSDACKYFAHTHTHPLFFFLCFFFLFFIFLSLLLIYQIYSQGWSEFSHGIWRKQNGYAQVFCQGCCRKGYWTIIKPFRYFSFLVL